MCELTEKENQLELEFISNYITYTSKLIASDIRSIYKYYGNNYSLSLDKIIECSKDEYNLSKEENELFYKLIKDNLQVNHNLKIISNNDEKLKLEEM